MTVRWRKRVRGKVCVFPVPVQHCPHGGLTQATLLAAVLLVGSGPPFLFEMARGTLQLQYMYSPLAGDMKV